MKKAGFIIAGVLLISIAGAIYYFKKQSIPDVNLLKFIPSDIAFFVDVNDTEKFYTKLTKNNAIWSELNHLEGVRKLNRQLHNLDSLVRSDDLLNKHYSGKRMILGAKKLGKSKLEFIYIMKMDNLREQKHLQHYFNQWAKRKNLAITRKNYNNATLYSFERENHPNITYSFVKGTLIASTSAILVENSVRSVSVKASIDKEKSFQSVYQTAGKNVVGNLYVNYSELPDVANLLMNPKNKNQSSFLSHLAEWSSLDINMKEDALLLNGFTSGSSNKQEMMDVFSNQEPVEQEIASILPANTSTFITIGISNKEQYQRDFRDYLAYEKKLKEYQAYIKNTQEQYQFNPEEVIYEIMDHEAGIAYLDGNTENPQKNAFIIVNTKGKRFAKTQLESVSKKACELSQNMPYKQDLEIDKETTYEAFRLPAENIFGNLFGNLFQGASNRYFTFVDNFVVFSRSPKSLEKFIYSNILNKTLSNDHQYKQFTDYISEQSNFHFYSNMYRSPQLISSYLNDHLQEGIQQNLKHIRKFQAVAYQFMGNEGMIYNNIFVKYIPEIDEDPKTIWECHLDTNIEFKPALVTNHYTGENEIFVQDQSNHIYLINKVGRILWKKKLEEEIISEVYQVDYYKNGKLQMLFNTPNKIHLIDRNGNYVERYPVNLPSPATTGISVFDYAGDKNYRIFVPTENKRVYDFNIDGDIIEGWNFDKTDTQVTTSIRHFRVKTKDYIVFADQYRLYILNRRGEVRVSPEIQISKSRENNIYMEQEGKNRKARMVTTNSEGTVYFIYFDGQVKSVSYGDFSEDHYFMHEDLDSDGSKDMIFLDDNTLQVFKPSGDRIFKHDFKSKVNNEPIYFYFSYNDRKIGIVSREANRIYLFNNDGDMYKGFPLKGNTPFSIGFLEESAGNFNLVVGNKYNFLYNYSVK